MESTFCDKTMKHVSKWFILAQIMQNPEFVNLKHVTYTQPFWVALTTLWPFLLFYYSWTTATTDYTGPILLDNVVCSGDESHILECERNAIGDNNCRHDEDVYLVCISVTGMGLTL